MKLASNNKGFSLTEVLLAVATLAIGMTFISGSFLAGVYLSTVSTEQTIAAVAANEAFAKVQIYGIDPNDTNLSTGSMVSFQDLCSFDEQELSYPSAPLMDKQYFWFALCRKVDSDTANRLIQVTVFVSRKIGSSVRYPAGKVYPSPEKVSVTSDSDQTLKINESDHLSYINDGYTIVDDKTGSIYRVLERRAEAPDIIVLDREWKGDSTGFVWVVPPPVNGGKKPCVAVYQKIIRF